MTVVEGKCGIYAKVLKDSISPQGIRILSFEIAYPRIILAELNTHGMLCKNSSSSRAIPFEKMAQNLTGRPVRFGANQTGMQDKGEDFAALVQLDKYYEGVECYTPVEAWEHAKNEALYTSEQFYMAGYHKQVYNRLTEPFQMMKTVVTATEYANFWWLRNHVAADPTLQELARCMYEAAQLSTPQLLYPGEWHLPYVDASREDDGCISYSISQCEEFGGIQYLCLEDAIKVSTARSAAVSFRNVDYDVDKSKAVCERLIGDLRKHGSAFQHQATPMKDYTYKWGGPNACTREHINNMQYPHTWEPGISHSDREGNLWSAQFKGWIMQRKLITGENVPGFFPPQEA